LIDWLIVGAARGSPLPSPRPRAPKQINTLFIIMYILLVLFNRQESAINAYEIENRTDKRPLWLHLYLCQCLKIGKFITLGNNLFHEWMVKTKKPLMIYGEDVGQHLWLLILNNAYF
jgi:hypothetical protein